MMEILKMSKIVFFCETPATTEFFPHSGSIVFRQLNPISKKEPWNFLKFLYRKNDLTILSKLVRWHKYNENDGNTENVKNSFFLWNSCNNRILLKVFGSENRIQN